MIADHLDLGYRRLMMSISEPRKNIVVFIIKNLEMSVNSLSTTLDATKKKQKLLPLRTAFRRHAVSKTKAGSNGKQTKINQDIAII